MFFNSSSVRTARPSERAMAGGIWVALALLLAVAEARAQSFTIQNGQTVTTRQVINGDGFTGTIEQGGTLNVTGEYNSVTVNGGNNNTVINNGTVGLDTTGLPPFAAGAAIDLTSGTGNVATNNGVINLSSNGVDTLTGAVRLSGDNGRFTNNGSVRSLTARTFGVSIRADNVTVQNNGDITTVGLPAISQLLGADATIVNTGSLQSSDSNTGVIQINTPRATITNSGSIIAVGAQDGISFATPSPLAESRGTVINSGSIIAPLSRFAINFAGDDSRDTFTLNKGGLVQGKLDFGTGVDTFNVERGISLDYTFETGGAPETVNANGATVVRNGDRILIVDPSSVQVGQGLSDEIAGAALDAIKHRMERLVEQGDGPGAEMEHAAYGAWATGFGRVTSLPANNGFAKSRSTVAGLMVGADARVSDQWTAGAFGGVATARLRVHGGAANSSPSVFGGIYANHSDLVSAALIAGTAEGSYDRSILNNTVLGGVQTISRDRDGYFLAPQLTVRSPKALVGSVPVQASVRARMVFEHLDAITDTASGIAIAVAGATTRTFEGRLQLTFDLRETETTRIRLRSGMDVRAVSGGGAARVTVANLGATTSATPRDDRAIGAFAGASFDHRVAGNLALFADTELGAMTDTNLTAAIRTGFRLRF